MLMYLHFIDEDAGPRKNTWMRYNYTVTAGGRKPGPEVSWLSAAVPAVFPRIFSLTNSYSYWTLPSFEGQRKCNSFSSSGHYAFLLLITGTLLHLSGAVCSVGL